jgi:hypothetical protein
MFDYEVKFLLDTKLIDSKNYDNSEVFKCSVFIAAVTKRFVFEIRNRLYFWL